MAGESDLRWTSPKTQSQIQRSKYLRDAITQMGQQSKEVFNTAEGTNYNILANAIMGYKANQAENRANRMVESDNKRLTDAILGTPQTEAAAGLEQAKPFDLTPGGFEGRAQGVEDNRLKAIAEIGGPMAVLQYQQGQKAESAPMEINGQLVDPKTRAVLGDYRDPQKPDAANIRQVGNQIIERQPDGSWKPVYTGATPEETARAFQGFIDAETGEQMVVMSNGTPKGTGRRAYIPPQITSVGGVPTAIDKLDLSTTPLSPLEGVAGNKAAIASAEVQGKAQGQAAFDLPTIEMRSQAAIDSIADLKQRDIGQRFGMQGKLYAIPGTDGADVQALVNQVTSQAFLNAFDQLRGAGAITEREGQAATQAITRLQNQNITVGEALTAMGELDQYYRKGLEIARQRSIKAPVLPQMPMAPGSQQAAPAPDQPAPSSPSWIAKQGQRFTSMAQPQQSADQPPPGIDPEDWKYMDDSQKALFR